MFNSVALDVVIGLVFIFLLYSLFATTIVEGLTSLLNIRGRILMKSIERMLTDEYIPRVDVKMKWLASFFNFLYSLLLRTGQNYKSSLAEKFYKYPSIKYLSQNILFKYPAYISAANFSSTIIEILRHNGTASTVMQEVIIGIETPLLCNAPETKKHLHDLAKKADGDANAFKISLELWFNEMMDRASGWYKINMQLLQLVVGFILAIAININTLEIVKILSVNETARNNMVKVATDPDRLKRMEEQIKRNQEKGDTSGNVDTVYQKTIQDLSNDSKMVSNLLGSGWHFKDSLKTCEVEIEAKNNLDFLRTLVTTPDENPSDTSNKAIPVQDFIGRTFPVGKIDSLSLTTVRKLTEEDFIRIDSLKFYEDKPDVCVIVYGLTTRDFVDNAWLVIVTTFTSPRTFFGLLITALAICLGAPFWFDLLSKVITLRGGGKNPDAKKDVADNRSKETQFDSETTRVNSQGHHLSEHTLKDPVRYALALNDQRLRTIPGVITVNKDFMTGKDGEKIACIEVTVTSKCDVKLIPASYEITFEGKKVTVPVNVLAGTTATFHNTPIVFTKPVLGIRNQFVKEKGKKEWGTATGLVRLRNNRIVILSCSHVLRGGNRANEVNSTTTIRWRGNEPNPDADEKEASIGKLLFQYQSKAFDVAWADLSVISKAANFKTDFEPNMQKIGKPREISDMDAAVELAVRMNGAVSGEVEGILWNNCVEFEFETEAGTVTMFNLIKLTKRNNNDFFTISKGGDSGALITDLKNNPIGIVVGGNQQFTYAIKLTEVFSRFEEILHFETV